MHKFRNLSFLQFKLHLSNQLHCIKKGNIWLEWYFKEKITSCLKLYKLIIFRQSCEITFTHQGSLILNTEAENLTSVPARGCHDVMLWLNVTTSKLMFHNLNRKSPETQFFFILWQIYFILLSLQPHLFKEAMVSEVERMQPL